MKVRIPFLALTLGLAAAWSLPSLALGTVLSSDVAEKEIYHSITAQYDAVDEVLELQVVFRRGSLFGKSIELVSPYSVAFDGKEVDPYLKWNGTTLYRTRKRVAFSSEHSMVLTSPTRRYANTIVFRPAKAELPAKFSLSQPLRVRIVGPALQADESITLDLSNTESSGYTQMTFTELEADGCVTLEPQTLATLKPGPVRLAISRSGGSQPKQVTKAGGSAVVLYFGRPAQTTAAP